MATRYYLAGPMSGYPEWNFPAFKEAVSTLRNMGEVVICPAEQSGLPEQSHLKWEDHMCRDVRFVMEVDAVIVLPGWEKSRGARMEVFNALMLSKPILAYKQRQFSEADLRKYVDTLPKGIEYVTDPIPVEQAWAEWLGGHIEWLNPPVEWCGVGVGPDDCECGDKTCE